MRRLEKATTFLVPFQPPLANSRHIYCVPYVRPIRIEPDKQFKPSLAQIPKIIELLGRDPLKQTEKLGDNIQEYRRVHVLLQRERWRVNHKRTYRICCQEGLNLRRKRPRRHVKGSRRMARPEVNCLNDCRSMDFVVDRLFNGQRFRALTIVDNFSRECLAIIFIIARANLDDRSFFFNNDFVE